MRESGILFVGCCVFVSLLVGPARAATQEPALSVLGAPVESSASIDGSSRPDLIPNEVAFRLFMRSLARGSDAAARAALMSAKLTDSEVSTVIALARDFDRQLTAIEDRMPTAGSPHVSQPGAAAVSLAVMRNSRSRMTRSSFRTLYLRLGPAPATNLLQNQLKHVKASTKIIPLGALGASLPLDKDEPDEPSCGELGGDHCSQSGSCPDSYDSLGTTYDCDPCCKQQPLPGPSCGELGGDHCSQSGSCPDGYDSLGTTYDCNPCCKQQAPQGPSCRELGGDYCSQSGSCPDGHESLDTTYDCNPCCKQKPPPGPSCEELGGDHCSQTGSCPSGYDSLGTTSDCNQCCKEQEPPPGPDNLYVYQDETFDGTNLYAVVSAETDAVPGHELQLEVSIEHDGQKLAWTSASGYPATGATTSIDVDGDVSPLASRQEPMSFNPARRDIQPLWHRFEGEFDVHIYLRLVWRAAIGEYLRRLWDELLRVRLGASLICYEFLIDYVDACGYSQVSPCPVQCAEDLPTFQLAKTIYAPDCPKPFARLTLSWVQRRENKAKCNLVGTHDFPPICVCEQFFVQPKPK